MKGVTFFPGWHILWLVIGGNRRQPEDRVRKMKVQTEDRNSPFPGTNDGSEML
jgi:hypothetical protein